jgi:chaperone required for assembly of F1-ATPase
MRLANATIDAVTIAQAPVAEEIAKYLGSSLLFYRASPRRTCREAVASLGPGTRLGARGLGARFVLAQGVIHVPAARSDRCCARAIPLEPWRLAAVSSITTLTGSALLALALAHRVLDAKVAWSAAHVDEDWQMSLWGAMKSRSERRAYREAEFQAADAVLSAL